MKHFLITFIQWLQWSWNWESWSSPFAGLRATESSWSSSYARSPSPTRQCSFSSHPVNEPFRSNRDLSCLNLPRNLYFSSSRESRSCNSHEWWLKTRTLWRLLRVYPLCTKRISLMSKMCWGGGLPCVCVISKSEGRLSSHIGLEWDHCSSLSLSAMSGCQVHCDT